MLNFKVSLLLPTARSRFRDVMRTWDDEDVEWLVSYEQMAPELERLSDLEIKSYKGTIRIFEHHFIKDGGVCPVWNRLAALAQGQCLGVVADDLWNETPHWRQLVIDRIPTFLSEPWAVVGDDKLRFDNKTTWERLLAGHPFVSRAWYDLFGYIWNPQYISQGCDREFYLVGTGIERLIYIPEWIYNNKHPIAHIEKTDEHYERTWAAFKHGREISLDINRINDLIVSKREALKCMVRNG